MIWNHEETGSAQAGAEGTEKALELFLEWLYKAVNQWDWAMVNDVELAKSNVKQIKSELVTQGKKLEEGVSHPGEGLAYLTIFERTPRKVKLEELHPKASLKPSISLPEVGESPQRPSGSAATLQGTPAKSSPSTSESSTSSAATAQVEKWPGANILKDILRDSKPPNFPETPSKICWAITNLARAEINEATLKNWIANTQAAGDDIQLAMLEEEGRQLPGCVNVLRATLDDLKETYEGETRHQREDWSWKGESRGDMAKRVLKLAALIKKAKEAKEAKDCYREALTGPHEQSLHLGGQGWGKFCLKCLSSARDKSQHKRQKTDDPSANGPQGTYIGQSGPVQECYPV